MPRTRTLLVLVIAAVVLSTGGRLYREHVRRKQQAAASAGVPNAQFRIQDLQYHRTPLRDVVADLQARSGVGIRVDWEALRTAGVSPDSPVDARLFNVRWEKALRVALDYVRAPGFGKNLSCHVNDDGTLIVTTQRWLFRLACLEVYDQRELFEYHGKWNPSPEDYDQLERDVEELLTRTVDPESWVRHGGPLGLCRARHGWVVAFQTPENHWSLQNLLEQLQETRVPTPAEREKQRLLSRLRGQNLSPEPGARR